MGNEMEQARENYEAALRVQVDAANAQAAAFEELADKRGELICVLNEGIAMYKRHSRVYLRMMLIWMGIAIFAVSLSVIR